MQNHNPACLSPRWTTLCHFCLRTQQVDSTPHRRESKTRERASDRGGENTDPPTVRLSATLPFCFWWCDMESQGVISASALVKAKGGKKGRRETEAPHLRKRVSSQSPLYVDQSRNTRAGSLHASDPAEGSPTATLLRLLLPRTK